MKFNTASTYAAYVLDPGKLAELSQNVGRIEEPATKIRQRDGGGGNAVAFGLPLNFV
jgi:hypothetical protein